ncbi:MAG TPA: tetratricopeptide repeat protein, partial [Gemmatimonadota bacterium]|nr:tetratricopeptide repeat protein [Gemmatimonadota bacterium]
MDLLSRRALTLLLSALVTAACASGGGRGRGGDDEAPSRPAAEPARDDRDDRDDDAPPPPPREISTDRANASDPGAGTPTRRSSDRLVEEGKGYLIAGQPGEAARRLEQATRIDPTNGFAWYHLGRARAEMGDRSGAVGVLQKAES